jgi:transcriptional regulator with XRE-family HTH domain
MKKRAEFKTILKTLGYSTDSIKSILCGRMKPTANKMFALEDQFGIPVSAWRDIRSYLQDNTTSNKSDTSRGQG